MPKLRGGLSLDVIYNGVGHGSVADRLLDADMNPAVLRPWRKSREEGGKRDRRSFITLNGKNYVTNSPSTLTKEAWLQVDRSVIEVARPKLIVWNDLVSNGLTYNVPDGMGTMVLQEQTASEFGTATMSLDGLRASENDRQTFDLRNYPLPIISGDFQISARQLAVSKRGNLPFDLTAPKYITRRIVEQIELLTIGATPAYTYGGGSLYGLISKPERITSTMTLPTDPSWSPALFIDEVLEMISDLEDNQYFGPYGMYFSPSWNKYMGQDYQDTYGGETLMTRTMKIDEIKFMRKLQYGLSGFQVILFQLSDDVIRAITGMPLMTLQWDAHGGLAKHFKVMCIMVPQVRNDAEDRSGIAHGVAA